MIAFGEVSGNSMFSKMFGERFSQILDGSKLVWRATLEAPNSETLAEDES